MKYKFAVKVVMVALLTGGVATVSFARNEDSPTDSAAELILQKTFEKYASLSSYQDDGESTDGFTTNNFTIQLGRPELYRIEWKHVTGSKSGIDGAVWSAGKGHYSFLTNPVFWSDPKHYMRMNSLGESFDNEGNVSGSATGTIPPMFFGKSISDKFGLLGLCSGFQKKKDAKVGGVDCFVLEGHLKVARDLPAWIWIGKDDLLIHKVERTTLVRLQESKTFTRMIHTQIYEHIVVNQKFTKEDFDYPVPAGLQPFVK